jgi:hypothetical protein
MKKIAIIIYIVFQLPHLNYAQSYEDSILQQQSYLFDHFINGSVLLKSGEIDNAPLNYCSYDQTILFQKDGKTFTLTDLPSIDTIYINEKRFVPLNNIVYEVVNTVGKIMLYVSYSSKMRPLVATTDHNGTSRQSNNQVSNTVSNVYLNRLYKGDYSIEIMKHYWLKDYNNLFKANNAKDFLKVFRESTHTAILDYLKQNYIDFKNESDLVKLVNFCNRQ